MPYIITGIVIVIIVLLVLWFKQAPRRSGLEHGTRITLTSKYGVLHATLNHSVAAKSFEDLLPMDISFGKSGVDFCTTAPNLKTKRGQGQFGWHLGDITYVGGWLSIFYAGQHRLPMKLMVLGNIDKEDIQLLKSLNSQVSFKIEIEK